MTEELTRDQTRQRLIGAVCATFGASTPANAHDRVNALLEYAVDLLNSNPGLADKTPEDLWHRLAIFSKVLLPETALVNQLHANHTHPDYEYGFVESGRKQGDGEPPPGYGWETNWIFMADGKRHQDHSRDDFTDTAWWRRLKTDAARDEVDPFDHKRPRVTLDPINLHAVLMLLAKRLNPGYFPVPKVPDINSLAVFKSGLMQKTAEDIAKLQRPEFNSKPHYIESGSFLHGLEPGVNKFQPNPFQTLPGSIVNSTGDVIVNGNNITMENSTPVKCNTESLYAYIEMKETDILVDLNNPFESSFVRINLKGVAERAPFRRWVHFATLPINTFVLEEAIQIGF